MSLYAIGAVSLVATAVGGFYLWLYLSEDRCCRR